eukprot:363790-Chlamydomonas_euryale.AAC.12
MSEVYTVPDAVLFRNFEVLSQHSAQTRNLLLQNKTQEPLQAYVSRPFTQHFGLRLAPGDSTQRLVSTPPHVAATVQPGTPCKVCLLAALQRGRKHFNPNTSQNSFVCVWKPLHACMHAPNPCMLCRTELFCLFHSADNLLLTSCSVVHSRVATARR